MVIIPTSLAPIGIRALTARSISYIAVAESIWLSIPEEQLEA